MTDSRTLDDLDIPGRVARGAALLDEKRPGWEAEINLNALDIDDCTTCVIGQLYRDHAGIYSGAYEIGADALLGPDGSALADHGFNAIRGLDPDDVEWGALTSEWKRVIQERRSAVEIPAGGES